MIAITFFTDPPQLNAVYNKPSSARTAAKVEASLLLAIARSIEPPDNAAWSWLAGADKLSAEVRTFRETVHTLYALAHTALSPSVSALLVQALFAGPIADDALAFLASVWTDPTASTALAVRALDHALVFVRAVEGTELAVDFQAAIPTVIVALASSERRVRDKAVGLLEAVLQSPGGESGTDRMVSSLFYGSTGACDTAETLD